MKICNFCGKSLDDVRLMIADSDSDSDICDECVFVCMDLIINHLKVHAEVPIKNEGVL